MTDTQRVLDAIKPAVMGWTTPPNSQYTPSLTNVTNISSSVAAELQFARIGDTVLVSGGFTATATAAGGCVMRMSLPIASTFTNQGQLGGTAVGTQLWPAYARGSTTTYDAVFVWTATNTTATTFYFTFFYRIL